MPPLQPPPDSRLRRFLRWLERLLFAVGAIALSWVALSVAGANIAQRLARSRLEAATSVKVAPTVATPQPASLSSRLFAADTASPVAILSAPRLQLSAVVLEGSDDATLRRGPGHVEQTAEPGDGGNVVIAGHRDSFFWPLRDVREGDDFFLETPALALHYRVVSIDIVDPHDVSVLAPTKDDVLTLITCYPFLAVGPAAERLVVRAARVP